MKRNHLAGFSVQSSIHTKLTGSNCFLLIGSRDHCSRAALADIQFNRTGLDTKTAAYKILEILTAACKHLVTEGVRSYRTVIFTDESSFRIVYSLRNTDDEVAVRLESLFQILKKSILIKVCFRKIDKKRIIPLIFTREGTGSSEPSCMTSHDLDDRYRFFLINIGIQSNLTDSRCNISGSTSETRGVICMDQGRCQSSSVHR